MDTPEAALEAVPISLYVSPREKLLDLFALYPQASYNLKDRPDRVLLPHISEMFLWKGEAIKGNYVLHACFFSFKASAAKESTSIFLRLCLCLLFILHFLLYWGCLRRTVMMMDTNRAGIGFSC